MADDVVDLVQIYRLIREMVVAVSDQGTTTGQYRVRRVRNLQEVRFVEGRNVVVVHQVPDAAIRVRGLIGLAMALLNKPSHRRQSIRLPVIGCSVGRHHELQRVLLFLEPPAPHYMFSLVVVGDFIRLVEANGYQPTEQEREEEEMVIAPAPAPAPRAPVPKPKAPALPIAVNVTLQRRLAAFFNQSTPPPVAAVAATTEAVVPPVVITEEANATRIQDWLETAEDPSHHPLSDPTGGNDVEVDVDVDDDQISLQFDPPPPPDMPELASVQRTRWRLDDNPSEPPPSNTLTGPILHRVRQRFANVRRNMYENIRERVRS